MKTTHFWASIALSPTVLAQGLRQATGGPEPTITVQRYPEPTPEVSNCTASLITTLCDYKSPGPSFAVASSGKAHCWEYCNAHQPCNFVIFNAGNPYTGTGTCWLYPGETFDESAGEKGCDVRSGLSVWDKPTCAEPTPTAGACAATASPTLVDKICDYPTPDDNCWSTCSASDGAVNCLSQCTKREDCGYVVFNPHNSENSPYGSGTCWMFPNNGTYDAGKAGTCSGAPEQFVYENPCPKPKSSPKESPEGSDSDSSSDSGSGSGSGSGSPSGSASEGASQPSATGSGSKDAKAEQAAAGAATLSPNASGAAPASFSVGSSLVVGLAVLLWQGLQ